jgi:hypothetical protein
MLSGGIGSLKLALRFDQSREKIGLSPGLEAVNLSVDDPTNSADRFQWDNHKGANIEAYYA